MRTHIFNKEGNKVQIKRKKCLYKRKNAPTEDKKDVNRRQKTALLKGKSTFSHQKTSRNNTQGPQLFQAGALYLEKKNGQERSFHLSPLDAKGKRMVQSDSILLPRKLFLSRRGWINALSHVYQRVGRPRSTR